MPAPTAADFVVGVGQEGGIDVRLPNVELLFLFSRLFPLLEELFRPRRQPGDNNNWWVGVKTGTTATKGDNAFLCITGSTGTLYPGSSCRAMIAFT